ncbi:MAG: hypothetical protein WC955_05645 [Elusimicrobiota bacterium]
MLSNRDKREMRKDAQSKTRRKHFSVVSPYREIQLDEYIKWLTDVQTMVGNVKTVTPRKFKTWNLCKL